MNKRAYKSPLREEQMEQTRSRLLEQVVTLLGDESATELSVAEVARRANVSVRTAYRYFPTREALIDAFNAWYFARSSGGHMNATTAEELVAKLPRLYELFETNLTEMRASRNTRVGEEVRARRKRDQLRLFTRTIGGAAAALEPAQRHALAGLFHAMSGFETWQVLTEYWKLSTAEASTVTTWAMNVLLAAVRRVDGPAHTAPAPGKGK